MNIIDFTKNGGYRLKQYTLRKMQEAYVQILKMFVAFCNIPETGNYIIQGCTISGANITSGYLYIDGELCYFAQTAGTTATQIKKNVVIQSLGFKNGNQENVFRFTNAVTSTTEGVALSDFIRIFPVFDANYVHTDNNYTTTEKDKLDDIEDGAEKNVQADWNVVNPLSDAYILNKPELLDVLDAKTFLIGDFGTSGNQYDEIITVPFPDVGTSDYRVLYSLESIGDWNVDNDTISVIRNKTATSFEICLREATSGFSMIQNLRLEYYLIRK